MPQNIGEMSLPEIHISIPIYVNDLRSFTVNIIKREGLEEAEIVAASSDLILAGLVEMNFRLGVFSR